MFLKRLKLRNVRCFEDLTLDFSTPDTNRKWTILLGENGTGKSTILRAAALVTAGPDSLAELVEQPQYWIRNGANACEIEATIDTVNKEERQISITIQRGDGIGEVLQRNYSSLDPLMHSIKPLSRNYFVAGYGPSRRLASERSFGSPLSPYRAEQSQSVATLFNNDAVLKPLEAWAMELDYQEGKSGVEMVRSVLNCFLPGLRFSHIDKKEHQLIFATPDGDVPLQYLSDGYQNVAAWTGDLLQRITNIFGNHKDPLKTRGLLIIDEIDLHLHPKWQRSLLDYLGNRLPNMQLLVTTHSAITAQQADAEEVHYLIRRGKRIEIHRIDIDPSKFQINQFLMTDAFGLESDEALWVEEKKREYRKLRDLTNRSNDEESRLRQLKTELMDYRQNRIEQQGSSVTERQEAILKQIEFELSTRQNDKT